MIRGSHNGEVVLDVRDVRQSLGGAPVLDGVSFSLVDRIREGTTTGQIASLLGPSGVGKTRLLRLLAGLDAPDAGTILGIGGRPVAPAEVGLVFQDYPLLDHRTVMGNLELAGAIGGLGAERHDRARELLALVGLSHRAGYYPAELSGGQRQRAAIAQQMMVPRRLLLLDEPFSGLDPTAIRAVTRLLTDVANEHQLNTVVIVTHDVRAALAVSDTVVLLGRGRGSRGRRGGATVAATYDLVDLGVAWGENQGTRDLVSIEREIESRFAEL
ncbi:Ferric iron ABC transporter, ATP-binding protein [Minicystis rosea]|nr:Ferric iron ABC transporter, ATP-binding protein [Minicystis rosea]